MIPINQSNQSINRVIDVPGSNSHTYTALPHHHVPSEYQLAHQKKKSSDTKTPVGWWNRDCTSACTHTRTHKHYTMYIPPHCATTPDPSPPC
ncbi:hypothetical protein K505DRAFT_75635 [Melanomma pulvis-pyrius CBS 109.77]|uniref:Uncharacterized protein n=1 Tax=Melanomma pulvis-pyrius CBS 109.77 TaxID=1314802 RepID=A0A6A6X383_9PLEO|nr:hypothetical protein K505DRAFT_75635 [Melanomma pulvis-pyrius CBS 109.77]